MPRAVQQLSTGIASETQMHPSMLCSLERARTRLGRPLMIGQIVSIGQPREQSRGRLVANQHKECICVSLVFSDE